MEKGLSVGDGEQNEDEYRTMADVDDYNDNTANKTRGKKKIHILKNHSPARSTRKKSNESHYSDREKMIMETIDEVKKTLFQVEP